MADPQSGLKGIQRSQSEIILHKQGKVIPLIGIHGGEIRSMSLAGHVYPLIFVRLQDNIVSLIVPGTSEVGGVNQS